MGKVRTNKLKLWPIKNKQVYQSETLTYKLHGWKQEYPECEIGKKNKTMQHAQNNFPIICEIERKTFCF